MSEYVNQHYVPESYLREWANNDRISGFYLPNGIEINESISDVCSRPNFYSYSKILEKRLGKLESAHSTVLREIRAGDNLSDLSERGRSLLLSFVFVQRLRTKAMLDEIKELGREMWQEHVDPTITAPNLEPSELAEFQDEYFHRHMLAVHHRMMVYGVIAPWIISGLAATLLYDDTGTKFLTSDSPVIFANPRFRAQYDRQYEGFSSHGLQIYCPISPKVCLLLYDPAAYRVEKDTRQRTQLDAVEDVNRLNALQMMNADSVVFFSTSEGESYVRELTESYQEYNTSKHLSGQYELDGEITREYKAQLNNPVHDLDPFLEPVHILKDVEPTQRPHMVEREKKARLYVHKRIAQAQFSEAPIIAAIDEYLASIGWE